MAWDKWLQPRNEGVAAAIAWPELFENIAAGFRIAARTMPAENAATAEAEAPELAPAARAALAAGAIDGPVSTESANPRPISPSGMIGLGQLFGPFDADLEGGGLLLTAAPIGSRVADGLYSRAAGAGQYLVLFSAELTPALVVEMGKREILTGGPQDPVLGSGDSDTLVLAGPIAGGSVVPASLAGLESVVLQPGSSYDIASGDEVAAGATLVVSAMPLGTGDSLRFDGSGETDGRLILLGGPGADELIAGAGDDRIAGMDGADTLTGGAGADTFVYESAGQSGGGGYDTLTDFEAGEDRIDLPGSVSGFGDAVEGGALSAGSFDGDLAAALGEDGLAAGQEAVLFAPDEGDLAGTLFLIVDGNGEAGYQAGEDFVFALPNADLDDLSGNTGIFV